MAIYQVFVKSYNTNSDVEGWRSSYVFEIENEEEAIQMAKEAFKKDEYFQSYKAIEFRPILRASADEIEFCKTVKQFELEDYEKNALGKIVRALERIAYKDFSVRSELTPIVQNSGITPFLIFSSVCSLLTIIVLIISKLLFP